MAEDDWAEWADAEIKIDDDNASHGICPILLVLACRAARKSVTRASKGDSADGFATFVLSAAALEGYLNELGESYPPSPTSPDDSDPSRFASKADFELHLAHYDYGRCWRQIEESNGSTLLKLRTASECFRKDAPLIKGNEVLDDATLLFKLRNLLTHPRSLYVEEGRCGEGRTLGANLSTLFARGSA